MGSENDHPGRRERTVRPDVVPQSSGSGKAARSGELYRELGGDFFRERDPERITKRLVAQFEALGHNVTLEREPVAA